VTDANRKDNSVAERKLAVEALAEARYLLQGGFERAAAVRAYYAAFHASRGLLVAKGVQPKTHDGLRRMLGLHAVLAGELSAGDAEIVTRLAYLREASDYATDRVVTREEAAEAVSLAEQFLRATGIKVD
jgi:uncharacterized protein